MLADIRDKELAAKLKKALPTISTTLIEQIVDSLNDPSSWNTYAYASLAQLVETLTQTTEENYDD